MLSAKKTLAILMAAAILLSGESPAVWLMKRILPGRWMLYAGGGYEEIWDFHADGTVGDGTHHTWRAEAAAAEDRERIWSHPTVVLVIDEKERCGLHFDWRDMLAILADSCITEEEKALAAPLPLCISITMREGGGGYVRMKDD